MTDFNQARDAFISSLDNDNFMFADTLAFIDRWYVYTPTAFRNGTVHNGVDQNQGSCKVLGLVALLGFDSEQTLRCFGEHYRDVLASPEADNHHNLRRLCREGPTDIAFEQFPLAPREQG